MTTTIDRQEELRRLSAELQVLEEFDLQRASRGHDYGAGQRAGELGRLRHEHAATLAKYKRSEPRGAFPPEPSKGDLARAFNRLLVPRARRATREIAEHLEATKGEPGPSVRRRIYRLRLVPEAMTATAAALELPIASTETLEVVA